MTPSAFKALYAQATLGQPRGMHDCEPALRLVFVEDMGLRQAALKTGVPFTAASTAHNQLRKAIQRATPATPPSQPCQINKSPKANAAAASRSTA